MNFLKGFTSFINKTGPARFLVPFGILLVVFGIILMNVNTDNYLETTGTVTSVFEHPGTSSDDWEYDVEFAYTVDGKEYQGSITNSTSPYIEGEEIKVLYDPAQPTSVVTGDMPAFLPPVLIAVGAVALLAGVFFTLRAMGKR